MSQLQLADRDDVLREAWRLVAWVDTIDKYTGRQKARKAARRLGRFLDAITHTGIFEPFDRPVFIAVAYAIIEAVYLARKHGADAPEAAESGDDQVDDDADLDGDQVVDNDDDDDDEGSAG